MWCDTQAETLHDMDILVVSSAEIDKKSRKLKLKMKFCLQFITLAKRVRLQSIHLGKDSTIENLRTTESESTRRQLRHGEAMQFCLNLLTQSFGRTSMLTTVLGTKATGSLITTHTSPMLAPSVNRNSYKNQLLLLYPEVQFDDVDSKLSRSEAALQVLVCSTVARSRTLSCCHLALRNPCAFTPPLAATRGLSPALPQLSCPRCAHAVPIISHAVPIYAHISSWMPPTKHLRR